MVKSPLKDEGQTRRSKDIARTTSPTPPYPTFYESWRENVQMLLFLSRQKTCMEKLTCSQTECWIFTFASEISKTWLYVSNRMQDVQWCVNYLNFDYVNIIYKYHQSNTFIKLHCVSLPIYIFVPFKINEAWKTFHLIHTFTSFTHPSFFGLFCINLLLLSSSSFPLLSSPNAKPLVPLPDPDRVPEPPPKDKVAESHAGSSADEEPKGACTEEGTKRKQKKTKKKQGCLHRGGCQLRPGERQGWFLVSWPGEREWGECWALEPWLRATTEIR